MTSCRRRGDAKTAAAKSLLTRPGGLELRKFRRWGLLDKGVRTVVVG